MGFSYKKKAVVWCLLRGFLSLGLLLSAAHLAYAQQDDTNQAENSLDLSTTDPAAPTGEDLVFWEQWNAYIAELIRDSLETPDPWEGWNRKVYAFNDVADRYALKPVAKGYRYITPDPVEIGISNVFANLFEIRTIANDLLQFKLLQAASDTGRFVINTTLGLVGIFDVATVIGLERHREDFGQTLGYWGVGSGPYLVLPLLGSNTVRDSFAMIPDSYLDLIPEEVDHVRTRNQLMVTRLISGRAALFTAEELITGDRYTFIRDAYLQRREFLVNDGAVEDSFGEEDFDESWGDDEF